LNLIHSSDTISVFLRLGSTVKWLNGVSSTPTVDIFFSAFPTRAWCEKMVKSEPMRSLDNIRVGSREFDYVVH